MKKLTFLIICSCIFITAPFLINAITVSSPISSYPPGPTSGSLVHLRDRDGDGYYYFVAKFPSMPGFDRFRDCNDHDATIHPRATEICNNIDEDCDGVIDEDLTMYTYYQDADADGYGNVLISTSTCLTEAPAGYVSNNTDCNDSNNLMNPGMLEYCNGYDDDCDTTTDENDAIDANTYYADTDHDTYGNPALTQRACSQPSNYVTNNTDCNDASNTVYPGATETFYDGIDSNCAGESDYDADYDGYDSEAYGGTDCNDTNNAIYPLARETYYDGIDQNCDGASDYDADIDTYDAEAYGGNDCDDSDVTVGHALALVCAQDPIWGNDTTDISLCSGECMSTPSLSSEDYYNRCFLDENGNRTWDNEDYDLDGVIDTEDTNHNGHLDSWEDTDHDGVIDTEDTDGDGVLDAEWEMDAFDMCVFSTALCEICESDYPYSY